MTFHFLDQDNESHWYIIPVAHKEEWDAWLELPSDDEASWEPPEFANRIGGSPRSVLFTQYVETQQ